jgi:hypothetical protein
MLIRVTFGHYRNGSFVPPGQLLELPTEVAQAMLRGGTAQLADKSAEQSHNSKEEKNT